MALVDRWWDGSPPSSTVDSTGAARWGPMRTPYKTIRYRVRNVGSWLGAGLIALDAAAEMRQ